VSVVVESPRATPPPLSLEVVTSEAGLAALAPDWQRVQDACPWKHVLLDHRWVSAWWRCFGDGKELHCLLLRRGASVVGIAPFILSRGLELFPARDSMFQLADDYAHLTVPRSLRILPIRRVTFPLNISSHNARAHLLLQEEPQECFELVAKYWFERSGQWDLIALDGLPDVSSQRHQLIEAGRHQGGHVPRAGMTRTIFHAPLPATFDDYLAARTGHFRKRLKAELRGCRRAGEITIERYGGESIDRGLEILFAIEQRTWKVRRQRRRKVYLALDEITRRFFTEVAHAFAATGGAEILVMSVDGRPAGALFTLARQETILSLVIYLDDAYRGRVTTAPLWRAFLEGAVAHGYRGIDFHGNTVSVQKWALDSATYRRLYLFNRWPYSRLLGSAKGTAAHLSRALRRMRGEG